MPYDSVIDRTDAGALIPTEVANEIIKAVPQSSAVMRMAKRLPNMSRYQRNIPVMSALASAYFINPGADHSDTGLKQTTEVTWENVYLYAEEIAAIVPIPEAVLDDSDYDIWGEVKPSLIEAFGQVFDAAVLYGTNAPAPWPDDLLTRCTAAGHVVQLGAVGDLYDDLLSEGGTISKIEEDGFMATGHIAHLTLRAKLRGLRDDTQQPLFKTSLQSPTQYELDGVPLEFPMNGSVNPASSLLISGQWNQLVYAIRQDMTFKILTEAVIQDAAGAIKYNLAQQDMVALRAVMRLGWALPNPINRINAAAATRCAFSILAPAP